MVIYIARCISILALAVLTMECSSPSITAEIRARDIVRELVRLSAPCDSPSDGDGMLRILMAGYHPQCGWPYPKWLFTRPDQEMELLKIGGPAVKPVLEALADASTHPGLRARFAHLLAYIGDGQVAYKLGVLIKSEICPMTRMCIVHTLGLIGSPENLPHIIECANTGRIPDRLVSWAAAM